MRGECTPISCLRLASKLRTAGEKGAPLRRQLSIDKELSALEGARRASAGERAVVDGLARLGAAELRDSESLARFHDALLFLRAYPQSPRVARLTESLLRDFGRRVTALRVRGDFDPLLELDVSGITGTSVETNSYPYDCIRWLAERFPGKVSIDWDLVDAPDRVAALLRRFLPLLEEESSADANVAVDEWIRAARAMNRDGGLAWLLQNLERLDVSPRLRAELFEGLGLFIRWDIESSPASRTRMRRAARPLFIHDAPLLGRRDVDLDREMSSARMPVSLLSKREGAAVLDLAREAMATRYRELYGFTYGDPAAVIAAEAGRGFEIVICGITPERRLPVRAGFGTLLVKNGVPVGYADAYGIGERLEISLNIFYAYRDGESAWCFARMLKLYRQLFDSAVFSLDAYQIGKGNEEAIKSGAFWFYRKLGFRSTDPAVEVLARREEERMASRREHRTSANVLRRMASGNVVYEVPGSPRAAWDRFHIRNLGLAVQRTMAKSGLEADPFRADCCERAAAALGIGRRSFNRAERQAFERMAPLLAIIPSLERWSEDDRATLVDAVRAKASRGEAAWLRLTARHQPLQRALLKLGSSRR